MSKKRRSSKRFVTSASQHDTPRLFIDRDAWSRRLGEALDAAGVAYVAHRQRFDASSPDEDWTQFVSHAHLIAITRDQNIRRKPNELATIRASRAVIFVFTSGNLTAADTARLLMFALPAIYRTEKGAKRPALYSIRKNGSIGNLKL